MRQLLSLWAPVAAYMAGLFVLSAQPALPDPTSSPDWLQHGLAYAGLALVSLRAVAGGRWSRVTFGMLAAAWLIATLFGISDEFHQSFVPERSPDVRDVIADAAGAAIGLAAAWAWGIIRRSP